MYLEGGSVQFQCNDAGEIWRCIVSDETVNHFQYFSQTILLLHFFFLIPLLHETHLSLLRLLPSFFFARRQFLLHGPIDLGKRAMMHTIPSGYSSSLEVKSQQFLPGNPFKMIFDQHQSKQFFKLWGYGVDISVDVQILMLQDVDKTGYRVFLEGTEPKGHFVDHYSQAPNIRLHRVYLSPQDLRSHVDGRAQHGLCQIPLAFQTLAESEVSQSYCAIVQHDIGGFQIAVHDVTGCQHAEGFNQLLQEANHLRLGQIAIPSDFLIECASVAELIEEVEIIDGLQDLDEADDIEAFDAREHLDFIEGAFLQFGVFSEAAHVDYFGCYFATSTTIHSSIDLPVLALADLFVEGVVLDYLDHPLVLNYITLYERREIISEVERVVQDGQSENNHIRS